MTPDELCAARKALGLTQRGLAEAMSMGKWGYQTVGKWERGEKPIPAHYVLIVRMLLSQLKEPDNAK